MRKTTPALAVVPIASLPERQVQQCELCILMLDQHLTPLSGRFRCHYELIPTNVVRRARSALLHLAFCTHRVTLYYVFMESKTDLLNFRTQHSHAISASVAGPQTPI
jgi:hypothetical protein